MKKRKGARKASARLRRKERKKKLIFAAVSGVLAVTCVICTILFRNNISWIPFALGALLALIGLANALWRVVNRGIFPVLAALCAVLAVMGQFSYVTIGGHTYSTMVQTLDVSADGLTGLEGMERCRYLKTLDISGLGISDVSPLLQLDGLETLDMRGNPVSEEQYIQLRDALPETEIFWSAPLGQTRLDSRETQIRLPEDGYVTIEMLLRQLGYFENLTDVDLTAVKAITAAEAARIETEYPDVELVWMAPAGNGIFSTEESSLTLASFESAEALLEQLSWFKNLQTLDIRSCNTEAEDVRRLVSALENVRVSWQISYKGVTISDTDAALNLNGVQISDISELAQILDGMKELKQVDLNGTGIVNRDLYALVSQFPQVQFAYTLDVFGVPISTIETQASLASVSVNDAQILAEAVAHLPNLTYLDLGLCALPSETLKEIRDQHEDLEMIWSINVCGYSYRTDAEEMNFYGMPIDSLAALDEALQYMPSVTKINLSGCGQPDSSLARFQEAHPDIKVVWTVNLGRWIVSTDATFFSTQDTSMNRNRMTSASFDGLRYCTELQALDLGHQKIDDISFLEDLTDLRILILADNQIRDISVLGKLPKLEYVELFINQITDVSPLKNCPNLLDLNLCYNYVQDVTPIASLAKLERLWMSGNGLSATTQTYLRNALPGCKCNFTTDGSTGDGWREHSHYYTIRSVFTDGKPFTGWGD